MMMRHASRAENQQGLWAVESTTGTLLRVGNIYIKGAPVCIRVQKSRSETFLRGTDLTGLDYLDV